MSSKRIKAIVVLVLIGVIYIITCTRLKTPEIKGLVLDAETGQPITDARIYAKWEREMRGLEGNVVGGLKRNFIWRQRGMGLF